MVLSWGREKHLLDLKTCGLNQKASKILWRANGWVIMWVACIVIFTAKLKALKHDLKVWNKEVLGNVTIRKLEALNQISFWDSKEKETTLFVEEVDAKRLAVAEFSKWALLEELMWRRKPKEIWSNLKWWISLRNFLMFAPLSEVWMLCSCFDT